MKSTSLFFRKDKLNSGGARIKLALLASLVMLIQACGFQLRQTAPLPEELSSVALECAVKKQWDLCSTLRQRLKQAGASLSEDAPYTLSVSKQDNDNRGLTIRQDAEIAEYQLKSMVQFELSDAVGNVLLSDSIKRTRLYTDQASDLITEARLRDDAQSMLNQQIAEAILRQISLVELSKTQTREAE